MSREDFEIFDLIREERKLKRANNLAQADSSGWFKHTPYHWSQILDGKKLDYWPSSNKWQYNKKMYRGGLPSWIKDKLNAKH